MGSCSRANVASTSTSAVVSVSRPPPGIASRAFNTRLTIACSSCAASARTAPMRSPSSSRSWTPPPALELLALSDVREAGDDRPDLRLRDTVDANPFDEPPRAVAVADAILRDHGHVRPRCRGREALPRVQEVVGMDQVQGAASHQLRPGVAEQAGPGGGRKEDLRARVDQGPPAVTVIGQGPGTPPPHARR